MAEYFRCGERPESCARARKGEICAAANWTCPPNNPRCLDLRQPVPVTERYARELRWGILAVGSAALLAVLFVLLRTDPLQQELQRLSVQAQQLDRRLVALRSQPTDPKVGVSPLASLNGLGARARELEVRTRQAADAGELDAARTDCQQLATVVKQAEDVRQSSGRPGSDSSAVAMAAREGITDCDNLAAQVDSLRQRVAGNGKPALTAQCENVDGSVQEATAGFRKLLKDRGAHPVDNAELARLTTGIKDSYTAATSALAGIVVMPKVVAPFADKDATLVIGCTSDLATSLLLPLLQARMEGRVVSPAANQWYYIAGAGGAVPTRVIVRQTGSAPLAELFRQGIDLVVTERAPSAAECAAFAQAFPGSDLNSRALAEVIALDALTFLVPPNSIERSVEAEGARQRQDWIGGAPGSPERAAADRYEFTVGHSVNGPVADAMLGSPAGIGLGVYHLEGSTSKARQLPCHSGALALRPSPFTIATEDYKFAYRIVAYQNPRGRADSVNFVRFLTSDKGQEMVSTQGYVDLRLRPANGSDVDPVRLSAIAGALKLKSIRSATRLSTDLRFRTGIDHLDLSQAEAGLDLKAQADLVRLPIDLARNYPRAKVVILGFTDNMGSPGTNQPLSIRRADGVAGLLKQSGVDSKTAGLSDQLPVDANDTEEGRARNRRCEVWVVTD